MIISGIEELVESSDPVDEPGADRGVSERYKAVLSVVCGWRRVVGLGKVFEVSLGEGINVGAIDRSLEMSSSSDMWPYMEKNDVKESDLVCLRLEELMPPNMGMGWPLSSTPSCVVEDLSATASSRQTVGIDVSGCVLLGR